MSLPKDIYKVLDKIKKKFMWGNTNEKRGLALVCWDIVCQPKEREGLSLRKMDDMNDAFLLKISQGVLSSCGDLWARRITFVEGMVHFSREVWPKI